MLCPLRSFHHPVHKKAMQMAECRLLTSFWYLRYRLGASGMTYDLQDAWTFLGCSWRPDGIPLKAENCLRDLCLEAELLPRPLSFVI